MRWWCEGSSAVSQRLLWFNPKYFCPLLLIAVISVVSECHLRLLPVLYVSVLFSPLLPSPPAPPCPSPTASDLLSEGLIVLPLSLEFCGGLRLAAVCGRSVNCSYRKWHELHCVCHRMTPVSTCLCRGHTPQWPPKKTCIKCLSWCRGTPYVLFNI